MTIMKPSIVVPTHLDVKRPLGEALDIAIAALAAVHDGCVLADNVGMPAPNLSSATQAVVETALAALTDPSMTPDNMGPAALKVYIMGRTDDKKH